MKIQLDFTDKIIKVENTVSLDEFFKKIKVLLPDWKEWKLETPQSITYYNSPIIWDWRQPYYYVNPAPFIGYHTTGGDLASNGGVCVTSSETNQLLGNIQECSVVNLELN